MGGIELIALLWLLAKAKGDGTTSAPSSAPSASAPSGPVDGAALVRRANQARAKAWARDLEAHGTPASQAEAYARWIGIESSGDPLAVSPIGERGLLQSTATNAREGAMTALDWAKLIRPTTTRAEHARIALAQARWHWERAKRLIRNPPAEIADQVWYAKRHHSRPADLRGGRMHGPARAMAAEDERTFANDAKALKRVMVANVVAFGVPSVLPARNA